MKHIYINERSNLLYKSDEWRKHVAAAELDAAGGRATHRADQIKQGRFARTAASENRYDLAGVNIEIEPADHGATAVGLGVGFVHAARAYYGDVGHGVRVFELREPEKARRLFTICNIESVAVPVLAGPGA